MEFVTSADGTRIAYERAGAGPPLVLVHGSLSDRSAWAFVRPAFQQHYTVFAMDRRGRGEGGPSMLHALEREFEDVVAVIEAAGEPVDLVGHSFGAHCALGAAALVPEKVKHLVLYEPPPGNLAQAELAPLFDITDSSEGVERFMQHGIGMPPNQVTALKATPYWAFATGLWPSMAAEGRALTEHRFDSQRFSSLKMPALFLVGSQSEELLGGVLRELRPVMPHAENVTFEGQGHAANLTAAKVFAETVLEFLGR